MVEPIQQTIIIGQKKSMGIALILSILFGPLGLLYASVPAGLILIVLGVVVGIFTLGLGAILAWILSIIWSMVAVGTHFLRETAWVILNSGFRESIARKIFPSISFAYYDWSDASLIARNRDSCIEIASHSFKHPGKLSAMADAALFVCERGFSEVLAALNSDPIGFLNSFSFVGPVTAWHLAKNLGCDVAKPDRHLVRIADHFGYHCVHTFCGELSIAFNEKVSVVDLILWRFAASGAEMGTLQ